MSSSKYIPPVQRNKNPNNNNNNNNKPMQQTLNTRLNKKEKTFNLTNEVIKESFPTIGNSLGVNNKERTSATTTTNFSSAIKNSKSDNNKESKTSYQENDNDILPGWVYIRRHNGNIEYKYGKERLNDYLEKAFIRETLKHDRLILKYMIAREQWDRDREIDHLGSLSPYYNEPTIKEKLDSVSRRRKYINVSDENSQNDIDYDNNSDINSDSDSEYVNSDLEAEQSKEIPELPTK